MSRTALTLLPPPIVFRAVTVRGLGTGQVTNQVSDMGEQILVSVLGPLEVVIGGVRLAGLTPKERALIEVLALQPGRPVALATLIGALWEGQAPPTARRSIHAHVSRLRARLDEALAAVVAPDGEAIRTEGEAYALEVPAAAVDALVFERLVGEANDALGHGDAATAEQGYDEALTLWRGEPLPDLGDSEVGRAERTRLLETAGSAREARDDAALALGRHRELVGPLEAALTADPLHERRWRQLMLALYRSGRQADALRAFQRARSILVEELGIEPGPDLRRLEAAVIAHDPELDLPGGNEGRVALARGRVAITAAATDLATDAPAGGVLEETSPGSNLAWAERLGTVPLVDRVGETDRLRRAWDEVAAGHGGVILVAGEEGIGKTRLAAELALHAARQGALVLMGRASEAGQGPTPLAEAINHYASSIADADLLVRAAEAAGDLGDLSPLVAHRIGVEPTTSDDPHRWCRGLATLARSEAAGRPMMLVIDDLHLADARTIHVLGHAVALSPTQRFGVVGTYIDTAGDVSTEITELVAELPRFAVHEHVAVGALAGDDAAELLALRAAGLAGPPPDQVAVATLAREAGGKPLYLLELGAHLAASPDGASGELGEPVGLARIGLPETLRARVRRRSSRLPDDQASVLAAAAVVGPAFDVATAARAAGRGEDAVMEALDAACDLGLLVDQPGPRGEYAFATGVERQVLLDRLSSARRARIDARALARDVEADADADATAGAAPVPQVPDQAADRLRHGDLAGAWDLFGQAAELARQSGDVRLLAQAAVGAARVLLHLGVSHPPIVELLHEARAALPADDPLRSEVNAALLRELVWAGRWQDAVALSRP